MGRHAGRSGEAWARMRARVLAEEHIVCRVPTFMAAAYAASRTDVVATVPSGIASELSEALRLRVFATPVRLPRIDVAQHWHERFHREPGNRWIRGVFVDLFSKTDAGEVQQPSG